MSTSPKDLFARLEPGDLLQIPVSLPISGKQQMAYSTVLRLGPKRELYLTCPNEDPRTSKACCHNPFHWDDEKGVLVDRDGEVPLWYSDGIHRMVGEGAKVAEAYEKVPRLEHLSFDVKLDDNALDAFVASPLFGVISGLVQNGEAGSSETQLSLLLDQLGMPHTAEQLMALVTFLQMYSAKRMVDSAKVSIAILRPSDEKLGADAMSGRACH